jgi:DNA repair exonuclease SbcCD nuclease subunit
MRVAVTADLHLRESHPERLENLEHLIQQLLSDEIRHLIIAGDLLDGADNSYARIDSLAQRFQNVQLTAIPGNHDPDLRQELFAAPNIQVFATPALKRIGKRPVLFLPYREGSTIGETISAFPDSGRLGSHSWILVSHGDFTAPRPKDSGRERGYFPLTREDLARFKPAKTILGHIHVPNSPAADVVYPGSPYPITADEYGQRRVLILNTESASLVDLPLTHPPVRVRAEIFLIPDGREEEQIREQMQSVLAAGGSSDNLVVQVVFRGYSASRRRAKASVEALLAESGVDCAGIDLETLKDNDQENLSTLADTVRQRIAALELDYEEAEELRRAVLEKALEMVYGA